MMRKETLILRCAGLSVEKPQALKKLISAEAVVEVSCLERHEEDGIYKKQPTFKDIDDFAECA
ncbi:MAG: hypothetical protein OXC30_01015 [Alphaproteobacteria bacterium]|nr:hypothetical protein [Alphaproteobacteria bacterium]